MKKNPPKWADRLLRWFCDPDLLEEIQGDLYELYHYRSHHIGLLHADVKFIWEVLRLVRFPLMKNPFTATGKLSAENVVNPGPWNDMLFESRNKEYGAYRIRNSYGGNMILGFLVVVSIWTFIVVWWWINFKP